MKGFWQSPLGQPLALLASFPLGFTIIYFLCTPAADHNGVAADLVVAAGLLSGAQAYVAEF